MGLEKVASVAVSVSQCPYYVQLSPAREVLLHRWEDDGRRWAATAATVVPCTAAAVAQEMLMFQVLPGDLTAAKGSGNVGPLNPRSLCNVALFSMLLCHSLAGTETGQAKPSLSKKGLFISNSSANPLTRSKQPFLLLGMGASGDGCLSSGAGTMHREDAHGALTHGGTQGWAAVGGLCRGQLLGHSGKARACLAAEETGSS